MKRLRLLAGTTLFAVSFFAFSSTPHTNAQQTDLQRASSGATQTAGMTISQYETKGKSLFNTQIQELNTKKSNPTVGIPPTTVAVIDILIQAVESASTAFSTKINSRGATPAVLYSQALQAGIDSLSASQRSNVTIFQQPYPKTVLSTFINQIRTESQIETQAAQLAAAGYSAADVQRAQSAITDAQKGAVSATTQGTQKSPSKCEFFSWSIIGCLDEGFNWLVKNIFLEIAGVLVWVTANMLNYSIKIGILDFAKWAPDSLYPIWVIIRQIISLLIVFIGLYLGLMYILGRDEKFQKYIPWVIMFALFVNFSYPLARTAVDVSNVISLKVYVSAVGEKALDADFSSEQTAGAIIRNKLGLGSLFSKTTSLENSENFRKGLNSTPASLMALAFALYAAYIFFIAAIIIATRTAALVFLIVASPLLLVDSVLPMLGEKAQLLRKIFFEQLAVGPIFMIMLALTLRFLDVFQDAGALTDTGAGDQTIKTFFNLLMMLIMLHIMITVTKKTSGAVGEFGTNALGKVGGFAVGAAASGAMAGTGMLARKGLGSLAAKARDSKWVTHNQDSFLGRRAYNLSNSVANSTFDLRNTAVAQKYAGKLGISSGMGAGIKMGYDEESKAKLETRTKEALARSARIKTHHEDDVYKNKVGADGTVTKELVHRKGDVDAEGWAAKNRLTAATGGAALFMPKEQQQKIKEAMAKDDAEKSEKMIADVKAKSTHDAEIYKGINGSETLPDGTTITAKQSKARFLAGLENELKDLQKTDPTMQGNQAQSLIQSIQTIKKTEAAEKAAFDKQVKDVFNNYNRKNGKDQEEYLTNQSGEIQEAIEELKDDARDVDRLKDQARNSAEAGHVDIDLSNLAPATTVPDFDITTPSPDIDLSKPFNPAEDNFAAATRARKLKKAALASNADMNKKAGTSSPAITEEVPGTELPPTGPQPQASNDASWAGKGDTNVPAYLRKNGNTTPNKDPEEHAA